MKPLYTTLLLALFLASCSGASDPPQKVFLELDRLKRADRIHQVADLAKTHLARYPDSGRLHWFLGEAKFRLAEFEAAVTAIEKAIEGGWGGMHVERLLGLSHFYAGQFKTAQPLLEKVVAADRQDPETEKLLGFLYYHLGKGEGAIELFERLEKRDPADLEIRTALDALKALTGQWRGAQMTWYTDPDSGMQICHPGGWTREKKEYLGRAGKIAVTQFRPTPIGKGRIYPSREGMLLEVYQNASRHSLPRVFLGAFRRGAIEEGRQWWHATTPDAQPRYVSIPREPLAIARHYSGQSLRWISEGYQFTRQGTPSVVQAGHKGEAAYVHQTATASDWYGNQVAIHSLGIYDAFSDTFGYLLYYGSADEERRVAQMSRALFRLALFGSVVGVPPAPKGLIPREEYIARTQGFLQANQADRALAETQAGLEVYSDDPDLLFLEGESERSLWHMEEAVQAYQKARALGLSTKALETALGELFLGLGRADEAEQALLRALSLKPSDPKLLLQLALAAYRQDKLERAEELFERVRTEAPHWDDARYYLEAMKSFSEGGKSDLLKWFEVPGRGVRFCVPESWSWEQVDEGDDKIQVFFTASALEPGISDFDTGIIYVRYEWASTRTGFLDDTKITPERVLDAFLGLSFHRVTDPQKVIQVLGPIHQRGVDRYLVGGYAHTDLARRRVVRILAYYEPDKDRLHTLTFRTTGKDLGDWEPFVVVCFDTARFNSP